MNAIQVIANVRRIVPPAANHRQKWGTEQTKES
jgi:hypothetical protein